MLKRFSISSRYPFEWSLRFFQTWVTNKYDWPTQISWSHASMMLPLCTNPSVNSPTTFDKNCASGMPSWKYSVPQGQVTLTVLLLQIPGILQFGITVLPSFCREYSFVVSIDYERLLISVYRSSYVLLVVHKRKYVAMGPILLTWINYKPQHG